MRLIDADALQFEPDENCIANGILIWCGRYGSKTMTTVLSALKAMIDNAPTVDAVEVVHGRWIHVPSSDMMTGKAYKCSECNKMRYVSYMPNYCQCCGAKMDGDGNA